MAKVKITGNPMDIIGDMSYMNYKDPKNPKDCVPCFKAFFKDHPFILGMLVGYLMEHSAETLAQVIKDSAEENYRKEKGWGK